MGLAFTIGAVIFLCATFALVAALPALLQFVVAGEGLETLLLAVRWPILVVVLGFALCVLYRWGPKRRPAPWAWSYPGAMLAQAGMLAISVAFFVAVPKFTDYGE